MSHDEELSAAYEAARLAELGAQGARWYAQEAERMLYEARAALESLVRGLPNRGIQ